MARSPRIDYEGAVHHIYDRGNDKQAIFLDDEDCSFFLKRLDELRLELEFSVLAYCLMVNHYHLIIRTGKVALHRVMQRLLTAYSRVFNDRWTKVGHVFQGRYGSRLISGDNDLRGMLKYVHMNPVAAKLVNDPAHWRWSSHADVAAGRSTLVEGSFGLDLFGSVEEYLAFLRQSPTSDERPTLEQIAGQELALVRGPRRDAVAVVARKAFIQRALREGYRPSRIGTFLGRTPAAVTNLLRRELVKNRA